MHPKVMHFRVPTKEFVEYKGKAHQQFNSMYVCTLKVAGDHHGLTLQPRKVGITDFVGSQNSAASGGGEGRGGRNQANNNRAVEDNSSEESD